MKKFLAVAAVAAGALMLNAPAAAADDYYHGGGHHGGSGGGDSYALINGDVLPCAVAPWNWEGPLNILSPSGDYNACQKFNVSHG